MEAPELDVSAAGMAEHGFYESADFSGVGDERRRAGYGIAGIVLVTEGKRWYIHCVQMFLLGPVRCQTRPDHFHCIKKYRAALFAIIRPGASPIIQYNSIMVFVGTGDWLWRHP
jgi:hypothetical protein